MNCPAGLDTCPCQEYSKEGLCDYPFRNGMKLVEIQLLRIQLERLNYQSIDFHLNFNGTGTKIESGPITARDLVARIGTRAQILNLLKDGSMTPKEMADEMGSKPK